MSEHGSFITERIVCSVCLAGVREVLCGHQWLAYPAEQLISQPIIAGRVWSSYAGGEIIVFDDELREAIEARICHEVRIAVLAENGQSILYFHPPFVRRVPASATEEPKCEPQPSS